MFSAVFRLSFGDLDLGSLFELALRPTGMFGRFISLVTAEPALMAGFLFNCCALLWRGMIGFIAGSALDGLFPWTTGLPVRCLCDLYFIGGYAPLLAF